jgi:hypothetical protein
MTNAHLQHCLTRLRETRTLLDQIETDLRAALTAGPNVINIEGPAADSWQLGVGRIDLWRWTDAPPAYRALSTHGGDEDFVAFVPASVARNVVVDHLLAMSSDVYEYEVAGGTVLIGMCQ